MLLVRERERERENKNIYLSSIYLHIEVLHDRVLREGLSRVLPNNLLPIHMHETCHFLVKIYILYECGRVRLDEGYLFQAG